MSYITGQAIDDIEILRTALGVAITGKVAGDFATFEAYLLPTGATTATLTLTEIGNGEYAFTFTPSTAGTWVRHALYNSGGNTAEFTASYVVYDTAAATGVSAVGGLYATRAELKARIGATDTASDTVYDAVLDSASRAIDGFCNRRFYQQTATTKYFTADDAYELDIDDLVSVTSIVTDTNGNRTYATTWQTTDYDLEPAGAADVDEPYTSICLAPNTIQYLPSVRRGIKITGTWGWPAVPAPVHEACLLLAARYAKRPSAPFGIDPNSADLGQPQQLASVDPDVKVLLAPFRRLTVGAV